MATPLADRADTSKQEKTTRNSPYLIFKDAVRKKVGKRPSRLSMDIFWDIAVVLVGLKPGFLFDYTFVEDATILVELCQLVIISLKRIVSPPTHNSQQSSSSDLSDIWTDIKANFRVCKVASDFFVLNLKRITDFLTLVASAKFNHASTNLSIIDVSHSLPKPEFVNEETFFTLQNMTNTVLKQLHREKDNDSKVLELQIEEDWNVTSLFGFLLGYPVVYWYESSERQNGLSMVPLTVYKVYSVPVKELLLESKKTCTGTSVGDGNSHIMFSFSVPTELKQKSQQLIGDWFADLNEQWRKCRLCSNLFRDFELIDAEVTLPSVAL